MKTILFTLLILLAGAITASAQDNHKLTINVSDIQIVKGSILVAVCDKDNFLKGNIKRGMALVKEYKATIEIADLPAGDYAIMLFHDENGNYQLDMSESGVPLEGVGFSKVDLFVGMPEFEECKITVSEDLSIAVKLHYF